MMTIQDIQSALRDRRIGMVAAATGLHYNTIKQVRDNPHANPSYRVLRLLSEYLLGAQDNG